MNFMTILHGDIVRAKCVGYLYPPFRNPLLVARLLSVDLNADCIAESPRIDLSLTKTLCGSSAVGTILSRNIISIIAILSKQ